MNIFYGQLSTREQRMIFGYRWTTFRRQWIRLSNDFMRFIGIILGRIGHNFLRIRDLTWEWWQNQFVYNVGHIL